MLPACVAVAVENRLVDCSSLMLTLFGTVMPNDTGGAACSDTDSVNDMAAVNIASLASTRRLNEDDDFMTKFLG